MNIDEVGESTIRWPEGAREELVLAVVAAVLQINTSVSEIDC